MARRKSTFRCKCRWCKYRHEDIGLLELHERLAHGYHRHKPWHKIVRGERKIYKRKSPEVDIICGTMRSKRHKYPINVLYVWNDREAEFDIYTYLQDKIRKIEFQDEITEADSEGNIIKYRQCYNIPAIDREKDEAEQKRLLSEDSESDI